MESAQEVRYSGVVVGRGVPVRDREASGAFIVLAEPLPVGTRITLRGEGGEEEARVTSVTESANPDVAGMRVEFVAAGGKRAPDEKRAPEEKTPPAGEPPPETKQPPVAEPPPPAPAKPPVIEEPAERETPPVVGSAANEAAPAEVPASDSTASAAHSQGNPQDPGFGGSGKRRRRRR